MASSNKTYSRLDRLLTLLENGTTCTARTAAAKQLGLIQKKYPQELNNLLAKLITYLQHKDWDTRIAGAEAIKNIINEVPLWNPEPEIKKELQWNESDKVSNKLKFSNISISRIMKGAELLLSSSGEEFESVENEVDSKDRLVRARRHIERKLGLSSNGGATFGISSNDLFMDEDLVTHNGDDNAKRKIQSHNKPPKPKQPCSDVVAQLTGGMSNREKNRAKRKAKMLSRPSSVDSSQENDTHSIKKRRIEEKEKEMVPKEIIGLEPSPDLDRWPLEWICEELLNLLFSPSWEWRHGACIALRDILNVHGAGAGVMKATTKTKMNDDNNAWLEDASIRMLCVMVLDRFGDFVSDQMVAPVRESCAQALGVLTKFLQDAAVSEILNTLLYLTKCDEWEVRHAGFLGIKYVLAVRKDLHDDTLVRCLPPLISGLCDKDDDVRSVSADALSAITGYIFKLNPVESNLHHLINVLCCSLCDMDELVASTQSLLGLLSKLISSLSTTDLSLFMDVKGIMSRLWIFIKHPAAAARSASLQTLHAFLDSMQSQPTVAWFGELMTDGLWSLAECCILETDNKIQLMAVEVWTRFCERTPQLALCEFCKQYFDGLIDVVAQPEDMPYPDTVFKNSALHGDSGEALKYIAGTPSSSKVGFSETRSEAIARTRWSVAKMLGILCGYVAQNNVKNPMIEQTLYHVTHHLSCNINSRYAVHRLVACMIMSGWWESQISTPSEEVYLSLVNTLSQDLYFNEISSLFIQVQSEIRNVLQLIPEFLKYQSPGSTKIKPLFDSLLLKQVYSLEDSVALCSELNSLLQGSNETSLVECTKRLDCITKETHDRHHALQLTVRCYTVHSLVEASYRATAGSALSVLNLAKISPVVRPLMEGLKEEENKVHRNAIAHSLSYLLDICHRRDPCPNPKLIRNICFSLCGDESTFPDLMDPTNNIHCDVLEHSKCSKEKAVHQAVLTLLKRQAMSRKMSDRKRGLDSTPSPASSTEKKKKDIARAGALRCLEHICAHFKSSVFDSLPQLWDMIWKYLKTEDNDPGVNTDCSNDKEIESETLKKKMMSLVIIGALVPMLPIDVLRTKVLALLPEISDLISSPYSAVRHVCSRCFSSLVKNSPSEVMTKFVIEVLPFIDSPDIYKRMGIVEVIANIIDILGADVLPFSVLLLVPLLGTMSDQDTQVRLIATQSFASLIQYLPVESSVENAPDLSPVLAMKREKDRRFLEQLLDNTSLDEYPIPVPIKTELRPYQVDGIKWMAFLNRYKLHGILCDDMGLGKTLQSICFLASDHFHKTKESGKSSSAVLHSLVICPPTLTGHWVDEVAKFCDSKYLNPLHYAGNPTERLRLQEKLPLHNLVIASYEVVRNDISFFRKHMWNYCILDEGHIIRNAKNKLTVCVKSLKANHRLILTGTPIQNNVLELWSLFDFLMPGFLGSEQEFNFRYGKPILASRDAKSTSREQEQGVVAMEALHRQALPFMLRRMKEDVLQDLPPKIIQDYYCTLSPLQVRLYEDFSKTRANREVHTSIARADKEQMQVTRGRQTCHVFQALQYLQKVCNHPALVLTSCHPEYQRVNAELRKEKSSLHDIKHSTKLLALMQLLTDCGIGASDGDGSDAIVSQHRALLFCQHKSMLDIVEHDLLRKHMQNVTFLRLDGSVPASSRHGIVSRFNQDPSIDLLLLTTKVGGLGLNLTGADTVIFIEHDWNPTVDLQAMDRAHRIGQKRVVNVYRLITRATLEEKILSLQRFKLNVANAILTTDNSSLQSMETNQVLDLFTIGGNDVKDQKITSKEAAGKGFRALMEDVGELWDQNQYDTEYNLDNFLEQLVL